jgi:hypothetical protein
VTHVSWPAGVGAVPDGTAPESGLRPRAFLTALLIVVVAVIGAGILALVRAPGDPGPDTLRPASDTARLALALREPGPAVASTVSLRNGMILVDPPYVMRHVDLAVAAASASRALGGNAVVRCRLGLLDTMAAVGADYYGYQGTPVWMCVQVAPGMVLVGGVPRVLVAVSFIDAAEGLRLFEIREPA